MSANQTRLAARRITLARKKASGNHAKGKIYKMRAGRRLRIKA